MKQRTSFILKGLISLVLSLVMLCGTAVTSLSAVTVDLAETGADTPAEAKSVATGTLLLKKNSAVPKTAWVWEGSNQNSGSKYSFSSYYGSNTFYSYSNANINTSFSKNVIVSADIVGSYTELNRSKKLSGTLTKSGTNTTGIYYFALQDNEDNGNWTNFAHLSASVLSASYASGSVNVTAQVGGTLSNGASISYYYTTDDGTSYNLIATTSEKSVSFTPPESGTYKFLVTAADAEGLEIANSGISSASVKVSKEVTLYFSNNKGWSSQYAYYWKDGDDENPPVAWPGTAMKPVTTNSYGEGIYSISFDDSYDKIIFNGYGGQTVTIDVAEMVAGGGQAYCLDTTDDSGYYNVAFTQYIPEGSHPVVIYAGEGGTATVVYNGNETSIAEGEHTVIYALNEEEIKLTATPDANHEFSGWKRNGEVATTTQEYTVSDIADNTVFKAHFAGVEKWSYSGDSDEFIGTADIPAGPGQGYYLMYSTNLTDLGQGRGTRVTTYKDTESGDYWCDITDIEALKGTSAVYFALCRDAESGSGNSFAGVHTDQLNGQRDNNITYVPSSDTTVTTANVISSSGSPLFTAKLKANRSSFNNEACYVELTNINWENVSKIGILMENPGGHGTTVNYKFYYQASGTAVTTTYDITVTQKSSNDEGVTYADTTEAAAITYSYSTTNGTLSYSPDMVRDLEENVTVTLTQTPNADFTFEGWYVDDSLVSNQNSYIVTISADVIVEARYRYAPPSSTYDVTLVQKVTSDGTTFTDTTDAATIVSDPPTTTGLNPDTDVTLTQTPKDGYTFLGWYVDGVDPCYLNSYTFTVTDNVTVEARYTTNPTKGYYKFSYIDRYGATKIKTVSVALNGAELAGYSGNGNQAGVPTYLWKTSDDAKALFNHDPLLTASLTVTGHEGVEGQTAQDDVSAYKKDIVWDFDDSTKRTVDPASNSVTIEATTAPVTFTFKYVINKGNVTVGATKVPYGKVVTFNPLYQNSNYCYIAEDIPSDGFSYWSSDPEGNNILTTNRTFGMLLRGGSAVWDNVDKVLVVTAYAQYGKDVPENKWLPEIEEATLTRTIADGEDLTYADYMTNYFNYDGIAVQDMLKDSQYNGKIKYGILVVKSKSDLTTTKLTKDQMKNALNSMHALDGTEDAYTPYCASAALNSSRTRIAYRYEYDDAAHISNFNRTLYTLYGNEAKMNGYTFTAMAYITFDGGENYECSEVNTELVVANTPSSNQ